MNILHGSRLSVLCMVASLMIGCASKPTYDYTELKAANPTSILVLPPTNNSTDTNATNAVLAQLTRPLAEAGYYVVPVGLMDAMFKENGIYGPDEAQNISLEKLRSVFDADAALYTEITEYGSSYQVIGSTTAVALSARLVDLRSGTTLWAGGGRASSAEQGNYGSGGIAGLLVQAVVEQVVSDVSDSAYIYAGTASRRMVSPDEGGLLPGPRAPDHGQAR